eukprot:5877961-Ditylum_brightwellii.AAC.1
MRNSAQNSPFTLMLTFHYFIFVSVHVSQSYAQQALPDWRKKDEAAREELMRRLEETGEKEHLKQVLRAKLIECGWRDEMKDRAKESIRSRGGITKVTVDELVADLLPRGRASVPDS